MYFELIEPFIENLLYGEFWLKCAKRIFRQSSYHGSVYRGNLCLLIQKLVIY